MMQPNPARAPKVSSRTTNDTIAAISTPPGEGGIGIVRLSGPQAISIARTLFVSSTRRDLQTDPRPTFHGHAVDARGSRLDEVLIHVMRAPHSYTREDVVEINSHGGTVATSSILELALQHGARLAQPGEFTLRAFLNGRIDLVQAEAVIDQIQAKTQASLRAATAAASGTVSAAINAIKQDLIRALAQIEAAVDFPDEDIPDLINPQLQGDLERVHTRIGTLLDTARVGRLYREGASIVITGEPNVGKSSLFNALLRDARAIVSHIPGTTRDRIEEAITLGGIPLRLTDTAGLRHAPDEVEQIGVQIARETLQTADVILFVVEAAQLGEYSESKIRTEIGDTPVPVWLIINKIDTVLPATLPDWAHSFAGFSLVSVKTGAGMSEMEQKLTHTLVGEISLTPESALISRIHQKDSLRRALDALTHLLSNFQESPELLSVDLRDALGALGEVTGETTPETILETIFGSFCIGK